MKLFSSIIYFVQELIYALLEIAPLLLTGFANMHIAANFSTVQQFSLTSQQSPKVQKATINFTNL